MQISVETEPGIEYYDIISAWYGLFCNISADAVNIILRSYAEALLLNYIILGEKR